MGHSWKAEIIRTDGTTSITFADGDDVSVTPHVGLSEDPKAVLELNTPTRAVLRVINNWRVAAYNLMSSSCALWSSGSAGAIARGMYVRVEQGGTVTHIGRIKKIEEGDGGELLITSYDDLMQLGELRDSMIFFDQARDKIGDSLFANGPDVTVSFNAAKQITATIPDSDAIMPFMRLALAEPQNYYTGLIDGETSASISQLNYGWLQTFQVRHRDFFRVRFKYRSTADNIVTLLLMSTSWNGDHYLPSAELATYSFTLPNTGDSWVIYETPALPYVLTPGTVYGFGLRVASQVTTAHIALADEYGGGYSPELVEMYMRESGGTWSLVTAPYEPWQINLQFLTEREIESANYRLSGTSLVVDYDQTTIKSTDLSRYAKFLRLTYFYGKLPAEEIMERILTRAGFSPSRAGGLGQGAALVGFYNTGGYSYLECLQELADIYEPTQGLQWAFMRNIAVSGLSGTTITIGKRRKPWSDAIAGGTFSDDPASLANTKKVLGHGLRQAFESKVGTVRVIGKAFDGSPVFVELDDKLWSSQGSLVDLTGSALMEIINDSTVTTGEQAARTAEAVIREEHQNHLEGPLTLQGLHPEIWQLASAQDNFASSQVLGLTSPAYGLSAFPVIARKITIGGKQTVLDLDNLRRENQTMLRRAMDKALRAESFAIESLPSFVAIPVRYASTLPAGYAAYDRIKLIRADSTEFATTTFSTAVVRTDDNCSPTAAGYAHYAGYFPANRAGGPSSYKYSGGTPSLHMITQVALGNGSTWLTVTLPRPYWVWNHQAVLVDFYGLRP